MIQYRICADGNNGDVFRRKMAIYIISVWIKKAHIRHEIKGKSYNEKRIAT